MSEIQNEYPWYLVQTHAHCEDKVAFNLRRQGFEAYTPKYLKRRSHARKVEMVGAPLFPRYLFVSINENRTGWQAIKSTFGVSNFVCFGDAPAVVPYGLVEALIASEDENGCVNLGGRRDKLKDKLKKGQGIEIVSGPMAEMAAIFESMDDRGRVTVLLDLLGRQVRARVPLKDIRSVA